MNELVEGLKQTLKNEDARYVYADTVVNSLVSAQIKALRENRKLSQQELANLIGTKQSGISRLEKADYSTWKIETLRKLARAFGVRLRISFDEFSTLSPDISGFTKARLCPRRFEDDPVFQDQAENDTTNKTQKIASMQMGGPIPIEKGSESGNKGVLNLAEPTGNEPQMKNSPASRAMRMACSGVSDRDHDLAEAG